MIRPIAEFLALLGVAALTVHLFIPHELARILIYFVVAMLIAILFPTWRSPLEKDVVDLLYYTAAMTFVALLFVTKSAERERLHLSEELQVLEQQGRDIQAEIAAFGVVSANVDPYREWIDQQIEDAYVQKEEAQRAVCSCTQLGRLSTSCGEGLAATSRHEPGTIDLTRLYQELARPACDQLTQELQQLESKRARRSRIFDETLALARQLHANGVRQIGSAAVSAATLVEWLDHIRRSSVSPLDALVSKSAALSQQQEEIRGAIAASTARSKTGIGLWAGELSEYYWPYFLITLLGLKIARVDYRKKFATFGSAAK